MNTRKNLWIFMEGCEWVVEYDVRWMKKRKIRDENVYFCPLPSMFFSSVFGTFYLFLLGFDIFLYFQVFAFWLCIGEMGWHDVSDRNEFRILFPKISFLWKIFLKTFLYVAIVMEMWNFFSHINFRCFYLIK